MYLDTLMGTQPNAVRMVTYQFEVDDDTWTEWKRTVPRDKSLEQRLIELIEADTDGRVEVAVDDSAASVEEPTPKPVDEPISEIVDQAGSDWQGDHPALRETKLVSLRSALEAVRQEPQSKSELQETVYDKYADDISSQNERSWFRKTVKPYLKQVATYSDSSQKWHWDGK